MRKTIFIAGTALAISLVLAHFTLAADQTTKPAGYDACMANAKKTILAHLDTPEGKKKIQNIAKKHNVNRDTSAYIIMKHFHKKSKAACLQDPSTFNPETAPHINKQKPAGYYQCLDRAEGHAMSYTSSEDGHKASERLAKEYGTTITLLKASIVRHVIQTSPARCFKKPDSYQTEFRNILEIFKNE